MKDAAFLLGKNWRIANHINGGWLPPCGRGGPAALPYSTEYALELQREWDAEEATKPDARSAELEKLKAELKTLWREVEERHSRIDEIDKRMTALEFQQQMEATT